LRIWSFRTPTSELIFCTKELILGCFHPLLPIYKENECFPNIPRVLFPSCRPFGWDSHPRSSWARGGETYYWRATAPNLFVCVLTVTCTMRCQNLTPGLAHSQHPCMQPHFTPTSSPHTLLYLIVIPILNVKLPVRHVPLGLASVFAKDRATLHIHSTHSINICKHPTPTRLGKVYKGALDVPLSSPHQRPFVCGAWIGTAQVGVSLVSLFDPLFKRSRLHCFDICSM